MIEMESLQLSYGQTKIALIEYLVIKPEEKKVIVGKNGSGKTTLLKSMAGLYKKYTGELKCSFPGEATTYVHQEPVMFRGSVQSNITYGLRARGLSNDEIARRFLKWANKLGTKSLLSKNAKVLSGGEKKKVALIRALVTEPELLLVDEPLSELDDSVGAEFIDILLGLKDTTVIATTPHEDDRFKEFNRFDLS